MDEVDWILCGLTNVGNTCYMNAGLQALVGTPPLVSGLRLLYQPLIPPGSQYVAARQGSPAQRAVLKRLEHLVLRMSTTEDPSVTPSEVLQAVVQVNPSFAGFQQQDAQELIRCVLGAVQEESSDTMNVERIRERLADTETHNTNPACPTSRRQLRVLEYMNRLHHCHRELEAAQQRRRSKKGLLGTFLNAFQPMAVPILERGPVPDVFQGLLRSRVVCGGCSAASETLERFLDVSLEVPTAAQRRALRRSPDTAPPCRPSRWGLGGWLRRFLGAPLALLRGLFLAIGLGPSLGPITLAECLAAFHQREWLTGSNRYRCDHCHQLRDATKQLEFVELPEVLVLHAKRFHFRSLWASKVADWIQFPVGPEEVLDMRPYCVTDPIPAPDHTQYALFAVVVHLGGFGSGHYVAYVLKGGHWFLCDDEQVRRVTVDEVRGCGAYVLCYARTPAPADAELAACQERAAHYLRQPKRTGSPSSAYVSRHWLHKLSVSQAPGVILNDICYCSADALEDAADAMRLPAEGNTPAKGLTPQHFHYAVDQFYVPVERADWTRWQDRFGGGPFVDGERYRALQQQERRWLAALRTRDAPATRR
jgi:ubiquitin C-terminal hydrolase